VRLGWRGRLLLRGRGWLLAAGHVVQRIKGIAFVGQPAAVASSSQTRYSFGYIPQLLPKGSSIVYTMSTQLYVSLTLCTNDYNDMSIYTHK